MLLGPLQDHPGGGQGCAPLPGASRARQGWQSTVSPPAPAAPAAPPLVFVLTSPGTPVPGAAGKMGRREGGMGMQPLNATFRELHYPANDAQIQGQGKQLEHDTRA